MRGHGVGVGRRRHRARAFERSTASVVLALLLAGRSSYAAGTPSKAECAASNEAAEGLERAGHFVAARERALSCDAPACPGPVREDCDAMAKRLTAIIPTVVFDVRAGSRELHGVDVVVDGKGVEEGTEDARPVSIDPGEHTLTFHASGYAEVSRKVSFSAGDHDVRLTVDLAAPSTAEASSPRTTAGSGPSPLRVASIVTGGVAVVLLGTGVFFGVRAASRYSDATTNHCDQASPPACDRTGYDLGQDAHADARWSTIAVAVAVPLKSLSPAPRFAGLDAAA